MLSIAKVRRGGERYYLDAVAGGAEDHRRPGQEPDGAWLGRASGSLGLRGSVGPADLAAVLAGADPATGEALNPAQDRVRVAGFDLVFAAPKSVSLCYALGDASAADQVRLAHESAVAAATGYLERVAVTARRGHGDLRHNVAVEGVVAAAFLHRASRAPDPHLHTHVLVANLVADGDGRWSAFDARGLYAHARTAGYLYQAHLRHELSRCLGVEWAPVRKGMADIVGIDRSVIRAFSRRRTEIEARLAEEGRSGPKAARVAQLATRRAKDLDASFESMVGEWRARATAAGLGGAQLAGAMRGMQRDRPADHQIPTADWMRSIVGPQGLTAVASTFSRRDVIRACCSALPDGAAVATVETLADAVVGSGFVQPASWGAHEQRWTTPEVVATERALVESALRRCEAGVGVAEPVVLESALSDRPHLPSVQSAAIREVSVSSTGVIVATGARWAGAIDALDAARDAWQSSGARVLAGAPCADQAAELEAVTGIETTTLVDLVAQLDGPASARLADGVLVVHDAGRVPADTVRSVLDGAERAGAKVILLGEVRQLRAVEGGAFRRLGESLGSIALDAPRSTAWVEPTTGRGWVDVVERGVDGAGVVVGSSAPVLRQRLVADWWAERRAGREPAMVAAGGRELDALNAAARSELVDAGQLGESMTVGHREMAVGDRALFSRGGRNAGVATGTRATVVNVDSERSVLDLRTEGGRTLSISAATAVEMGLRHAYATTPREARRARPDRALILGDGRWACGSDGNDRCYVVGGVGPGGRHTDDVAVDAPGSSLSQLGRRLEGLEHRLARAVAPDPTAALAHLDQEQARTDDRLVAARSARSVAANRLEDLMATTSWTGRRAARQEAADVRTELVYRESEVRRWEARHERLAERRCELETQAASRAAGLSAQRPDLASPETLVQAVGRRQWVLARAAEVSPPGYLVAELGPRPSAPADRTTWRQAALAVESYRERWEVSDQHDALGGRPASFEQRLQRDSAARQLDGAQRRLCPERAIERTPDPSLGLEPASAAGLGGAG
ncbi:MAG: conjugative relaxase [Actinobacteria bacterium]|nr:MAG: conjugative relaxase [Actinomycetota bacterium]